MRPNNLVVSAFLAVTTTNALSLDINDPNSIKTAAKSVAKGLLAPYNGTKSGEIPGLYGEPYYWWSSGAVWDAMVDYWYLTGDDSYNDIVKQALAFQTGPNNDYMVPNQTKTEGNDDQSTWGLAALTALERSFPKASSNQASYLSLVQNVFDTQVPRWDTATCAGGLRWQIFTFNNGYNYKNSLSNAQLFELAARLARYTGNGTYSDWTGKIYTWAETVGLIDGSANVFDGTDTTANCSSINRLQWTANSGIFLYGSALMYNMTNGDKTWQNRTTTLVSRIADVFFKNKIMFEVACEQNGKCDIDQRFYKGILARDLARTAQIAPFTADTIMPLLQSSAQAAASVGCASSGEKCGFYWSANAKDESSDLGSQFSALEVIQANLVPVSKGLAIASSPSNSSTPASGSGSGTGTGTASGTATSASPSKGAGRRLGADAWVVAAFALIMSGLFTFSAI